MPQVDVNSDVHSIPDEETTITSTSMATETEPVPAKSEPEIIGEKENELKFGASAIQKWREKKDLHKAELIEKGGKLGHKWLEKTADGRSETREIVQKAGKAGHHWKEKLMESKEEEEKKKQVGLKLLQKVKQRRQAAAAAAAAKQQTTDQADVTVPPQEQKKEHQLKAETTDPKTRPSARNSSGSEKSEEESSAIGGQTKLKTAMTKVKPKVSIMKRKGAPPILSLPGDTKQVAPMEKMSVPAVTSPGSSATTQASENKRLLKTPIVSASPSPEPTDAVVVDLVAEGNEVSNKEEKKTYRPGGPQEMAGRIILCCKRGDWLTVESLLQLVPTEGLDTRLVTEGVGWTPVHFAAKDNRVNMVDQLISFGYNVNAKGKVRKSAPPGSPTFLSLLFLSSRLIESVIPINQTGTRSLPFLKASTRVSTNTLTHRFSFPFYNW